MAIDIDDFCKFYNIDRTPPVKPVWQSALEESVLFENEYKESVIELAQQRRKPLDIKIDIVIPKGTLPETASQETPDAPVSKTEEAQAKSEPYFMLKLKNEAKTAYSTLKKAMEVKIVDYDDASGYFNFKCDKGCVGLIFAEAGYTEYKTINRYIKINGKPPAKNTLANGKKNTQPAEWEKIREILFTTAK